MRHVEPRSNPWDGFYVCHERRLIFAVYDHPASCAPLPAVVKPATAIYALTTGPASHIGDDLDCPVAQNLLHSLA
jgi:hypothetical protein